MFKQMKINHHVKKLREGDLKEKMKAAQFLGQQGHLEMVDTFINRLDNPHDHIRWESACILGEFKDPRAIMPLIRVLGDANENVRVYAAKALEKLGEHKWITLIYGDAQDYKKLAQSGDARVFAPLARILQSSAIYVRSEAAKALGQLGDTRAVPLLINVLRDVDFNLRESAAEALGKLGVNIDEVVDALVSLLKDSHYGVRRAAVRALGELEAHRAQEALKPSLVDIINEVRTTAAASLAKLGNSRWQQWVKGDDHDFYRCAQSRDPQAIEVLFTALENTNLAVRLSAAHAIAQYCDADTIQSLQKYSGLFIDDLEHSQLEVRIVVVDILGRIGNPDNIPVLRRMLVDREPKVRMAAATALHHLGETQWVQRIKGDFQDMKRLLESREPQIIEAILKVFDDLGDPMQKEAVEALGYQEDPKAVDLLLKAMERFTGTYRVKVLQALEKQGDSQAAQPIISILKELNKTELKAAIDTLGHLGSAEALKPLSYRLLDPEAEIRKSAANALAQLGETKWQQWVQGEETDMQRLARSGDDEANKLMKNFVEPLKKTLKNADPVSRQQAITQLAQLGAVQSIAPLVQALRDKNPDIRKSAVKALKTGTLDTPKLAQALIDSLVKEDSNTPGRKEAIEVIKHLGTEHFIEALNKALRNDNYNVCVAAAKIMEKLEDKQMVDPLIKALDHNYSDVLIAVAKALGNLGDTRAVEPLIRTLGDFRGEVQAASIKALGNLGDPRAKEALIKLLAAPDGEVRKAAAQAVDKLGESQWKNMIHGNDNDFTRLGKSGDQRFMELFFNLLASDNTYFRQLAASGLAELDHPKWRGCIKGDVDDFTRLGATKDPRVFDLLVKVLQDNTLSYTIGGAVRGLVKLGDSRAIAPLADILQRKDIDSRIAAAQALCELGDPRGFDPLIQGLNYSTQESYAVGTRRIAAKALISLYKKDKLTPQQKSLLGNYRTTIKKPHSETVHSRSSDCCSTWHEDNGGIGLDF